MNDGSDVVLKQKESGTLTLPAAADGGETGGKSCAVLMRRSCGGCLLMVTVQKLVLYVLLNNSNVSFWVTLSTLTLLLADMI